MNSFSKPTCPLCGKPVDCAIAKTGSPDADCWCKHVTFNHASLALVPEELKNKACLCRECATQPPLQSKPG